MEITYVQIAVIMWHIVCTSVSLQLDKLQVKFIPAADSLT